MDVAAKRFVRERARNLCEYCRLPQDAIDLTFHIEHITAKQHLDEDQDDAANLALACNRCNLHKGTNLDSIDPVTKDKVPIFNPRRDEWNEHFTFQGAEIIGVTPTGRTTVRLLHMNERSRIKLRAWLLEQGRTL